MALGKDDQRHIMRIFFPHLYWEGESAAISTELRTHIYEKCLRQAAIKVNPSNQSRWPMTYATAMYLYRDDHRLFHFATIDFPPWLLRKPSARLLGLFQMHEELKDAFFVHKLRGMKGVTQHNPTDAEQRRTATEDIFHTFDTSKRKIGL